MGFVILSTFLRTYALMVLDSTSYCNTPLFSACLPGFDAFVEDAETPRFVLEINIDDERLIS